MKSETKHFSILYTAVIYKNWPLKPTTSTVSPAGKLDPKFCTRPSPVPSLENLLAKGGSDEWIG